MTDISGSISSLYEKDTSQAYKNLQKLEALSEQENTLYPYLDEFITMLDSDRYVVRVRGFRLLCKQARWDKENKLDKAIEKIMHALNDPKPTAVRQALRALEDVVPYKKTLCEPIKQTISSLDFARFKDTMRPLIAKDIQQLLQLIDAQ